MKIRSITFANVVTLDLDNESIMQYKERLARLRRLNLPRAGYDFVSEDPSSSLARSIAEAFTDGPPAAAPMPGQTPEPDSMSPSPHMPAPAALALDDEWGQLGQSDVERGWWFDGFCDEL